MGLMDIQDKRKRERDIPKQSVKKARARRVAKNEMK